MQNSQMTTAFDSGQGRKKQQVHHVTRASAQMLSFEMTIVLQYAAEVILCMRRGKSINVNL